MQIDCARRTVQAGEMTGGETARVTRIYIFAASGELQWIAFNIVL